MPEIVGDDAEWGVEAFRIVDGERLVGQMLGLRLRYRRGDALGGQAVPDRRQFLERRAVAVELQGIFRCDILQTVRPGEVSVQIVEAAVLRVDHYHSVDGVDTRALRTRRERRDRQAGNEKRDGFFHGSSLGNAGD